LPSGDGETVCLQDFNEDYSLVLFFTQGAGCEECQDALVSFANHSNEYKSEGAQVVAVLPEEPAQLEETARQAESLQALPLTLLADPNESARKKYANLMAEGMVQEDDSMIFVLDCYGAPYAALVGSELNEETMHHDIIKWLEYIGLQCPE